MRSHHLSIAACLVLASSGIAAADIQPLQLDDAERSTLEGVACRSRHDTGLEKIDGRVYGRGANAAAAAEVHCAAHETFRNTPVHFVVPCARESGNWQCQGELRQFRVSAGPEEVEVRVEGEISLIQAHGVVQKLANGGTFQGYPLRKALVSPCYVHQGAAQEFIDVKCQGWHIIVSTWCPQSDCPRVFSIDRTAD
ncbi:MAG TPA: hypothetical protein VIT67_18510 [Povalibacter sp.]